MVTSLTYSAVSSDGSIVDVSVSGSTLTLDFQDNANGTVTITVTASDGMATTDTTFDVIVAADADASAVYASGTGFSATFNDVADDGIINGTELGFDITNFDRTLPFFGVNQFIVEFDADVDLETLNVELDGVAGTAWGFDGTPGSRSAVIPGIESVDLLDGTTDTVVVSLDGVLEPATLTLSVDGTDFEILALPGDYTGNEVVSSSDAGQIFGVRGFAAGSENYDILADVNASGAVLSSDANAAFLVRFSDLSPFGGGLMANFSASAGEGSQESEGNKRQSAAAGLRIDPTLAGSVGTLSDKADSSSDPNGSGDSTGSDSNKDRDSAFGQLSKGLGMSDLESGI